MSHEVSARELDAEFRFSAHRFENECLDLIRHYSNRGLPLNVRELLHSLSMTGCSKTFSIPYRLGTHIRLCRLGYTVQAESESGFSRIIPISSTSLDRDILQAGKEFYGTYRDFRMAFDGESNYQMTVSWNVE